LKSIREAVARKAKRQIDGSKGPCGGNGDDTSARHDEPPGDQKRATSRMLDARQGFYSFAREGAENRLEATAVAFQ
jgi:hypothetical protein